MLRLIGVIYLLTLALAQGINAAELDEPASRAGGNSGAGVHPFVCVQDNLTRLVYLEYGGSVGQPPCSVVYEKRPPEPASRDVLWQAVHSTLYCELRAQELVELLQSGGWKCDLFHDVIDTNE